MPSSKDKYLSRLQRLLIARTKTGAALTTTLTANAAAGASALTVAAITNAADGDTVRIGSGNRMELNKINGAPSGSNIPLLYPLQRAHAIGEDVKEMTVFDHGAPNEGGVDLVLAGETADIQVSDKRLPLAQIRGYVSAGAEWTWPYFTLSTIIAALGALLTRLTGAGTVASPKQFITDGNELGEENDVAIIAVGVLVDGTVVTAELWGCTADYTGFRTSLGRGQPATCPAKYRASAGGVLSTVAPAYTIDVSLKASKTGTWRGLTEVGLYVANPGVNTTLTAIAALGAQALVVASSANAASGDVLKVGTGSEAEFPVIDAVVDANNVTLRTKLLHDHPIGDAVVEQTKTRIAAITEEGVSIETSGSVRTIREADTPLEAGIIPEDVMIALSFALGEINLANYARALGIPAALIVGNRLPLDVDIGTADIDGLYVLGKNQNGDTIEIGLWGFSQTLQEIRTKISNHGISTIPLNGKPAIVQFLQYQ